MNLEEADGVIMNRNFFLLWQGLTFSSLGAYLTNIVSILWLVKVADSASTVGLLMLTSGVSTVLFTPLGGVYADRLSRRSIIVLVDLCNGIVILSLAVSFFFLDSVSILIVWLFVVQVFLGAANGFFLPALNALLPDILPQGRLAMGNAIISITINAAQVLGRGLGGLLFSFFGTPLLLSVTGIGYLISAYTEIFIQIPKKDLKDPHILQDKNQHVLDELRKGFMHILERKGILEAFFLLVGIGWCLGVLTVSIPFLVEYHFKREPMWYGFLLGSMSLGIVIGSVNAGFQFNKTSKFFTRANLFILSLALIPIACSSLTFSSNIYITLVLLFMIGFFQGITNVIIVTQVQATVPADMCGRVMSIRMLISSLVFPISGFIGGILIDSLNKDAALVQCLSGFLGCVLIYPLLLRKGLLLFIKSTKTSLENA